MAQHQGQYDSDQTRRTTDECGNPVSQIDQHGNPVRHGHGGVGGVLGGLTGETGKQHGTTGVTGHGGGATEGMGMGTGTGTGTGTGHDGRKERHGHESHGLGTGGTGGYDAATGEQHREKKGIVDKVKEKIPGVGHSDGKY